MDALRLRATAARLLGERHGCTIEMQDSVNEYLAVVVDNPDTLNKWFQIDGKDPKGKTPVMLQLLVGGDDEDHAEQMMEDFALGALFTYSGTLYSTERLMPRRIGNLTAWMYLIADPQ